MKNILVKVNHENGHMSNLKNGQLSLLNNVITSKQPRLSEDYTVQFVAFHFSV